jgi:hypothetical protein
MLLKFVNKYSVIPGKNILIFLIFFLLTANINSQTPTNLEVFYSLTNSLVDQIIKEIPAEENKILLTLNLGQSYSLFLNRINSRFQSQGIEILEIPPDDIIIPQLNIVMEGAGVEYGEMFRDGWFGSHYVQRYSTIFGNYIQTLSETGKRNFELTHLDTVKVEDIQYLENESFPFTKGAIPSEPFISGFAEPLIAIATVAVVIALFFTIRSE